MNMIDRHQMGETANSRTTLSKWVVFLFVVAMSLNISLFFLKSYWASEPIQHRIISTVESEDDYHNVIWDDLVLIPRMHLLSYGSFFSDPLNSYNSEHKGWGIAGIVSPLIGGSLVYLSGHYFIAMFIWGLINFSLLCILIYFIFRRDQFDFSRAAAIIGVFLFLSFLWIGGQKFSSLDEVFSAALQGWHFSLVEIECGLFTYLPYLLFLSVYWRFSDQPGWKRACVLGGAAGFLTYVYFYHQVFAFAMIGGYLLIALLEGRRKDALYMAGALGVGLVVAVPAVLNNLALAADFASKLYMQRLDYSPGRLPFQDYHWLFRFQITFAIGILYIVLRKPAGIKKQMVRNWLVLGIAYITVLHLRVLLGFMQGVDHFWRVSLAVPASLWCILALFDLVRSRWGQNEKWQKGIVIVAAILPLVIFARSGVEAYYSLHSRDAIDSISGPQRELLVALDCLNQTLAPGSGFLSTDPALNYHTMVNLKGVPFMAMGLSPVGVDELSRRYLMSAYLTGHDNIPYPQFPDRDAPDYTYAKDLHLYLYVNLFTYPWAAPYEERIREIYQGWDPARIDWHRWAAALATVKTIYVENQNMDVAMDRLQKLYRVEKSIACRSGKVLAVTYQPVVAGSQ